MNEEPQAIRIPSGLLALLAGLPLLLLVIWNVTDPLPPAWDEAQHLLQVQAFGAHLRRFRWDPLWWDQFLHLNQRYPPLTYWLGIPLAVWHPFSRADGQLLNLLALGILAGVTQRIGWRVYSSRGIGWLGAGLLLLYPGITSLAHVYMLELVLVLTVTLAFWAMLVYWQDPSWKAGVGVGAAVAAVLLTKWTGVLFLVLPLGALVGRAWLGGRKGKGWHRGCAKLRPTGIPLAQMGLGMGVTLLLCWPWYGANWLFVLSNGFGYTSTAHYYITCAAGSLCWWTSYLRLLPQQMGPVLCGLPLLTLWPWGWDPSLGVRALSSSVKAFFRAAASGSPSGAKRHAPRHRWRHQGVAALWATYGSGYLLYTVVDIKDVRFTLPLLPLLAVLSAGGIQQAGQWLQERSHASPLCQRLHRAWPWVGLGLGSLALWSFGQPLTPGVAPLWTGIQMQWQGQHPKQELTDWIGSLVQPGLTTTLGVLPNTELISSETLTYLATLHNWPLTFRAAGQTPWPELELSLLDGFVDAEGEMGIIGPYGPAKAQIRHSLDHSLEWHAEPLVHLPSVGDVRTYLSKLERVKRQELPDGAVEVELQQILPRLDLGIPAWQLHWQGSARDLAQTLVWAELEDEKGQVLAKGAWVLGQTRLQPNQVGTWAVNEIFTLPTEASGTGTLHLTWQPPQGIWQHRSQPWPGGIQGTLTEGSQWLRDPLMPLRLAADAAAHGDLEGLSLYLNAWTTLQYPTFLTDPDRALTGKLLQGEWQRATQRGDLAGQIQSHYQQGLMLVALLQPDSAQAHFQQIVELDPEDDWARAYLAFLRVLFTHKVKGWAGLQAELGYLVQPLCQAGDPELTLAWVCSLLPSFAPEAPWRGTSNSI